MTRQRDAWRDGWRNRADYAETFYRRAVGELPEMESSKAVATLLRDRVAPGDKIVDVGCGGGHYLRSLHRVIPVPFTYTGVDATPAFLEAATRAWKNMAGVSFYRGDVYQLPFDDEQFDIVMCNDLLYHLPSIVKPVRELSRVAHKLVLIRTLIGVRSFRVQEVYSSMFFPGADDVDPSEEFADDGEPRSFAYLNIYSKEYFAAVVRRADPDAKIEFIEDTFFDPQAIERSASSEWKNPNPTRIIDGRQVVGYLILPFHFVFIHKR